MYTLTHGHMYSRPHEYIETTGLFRMMTK